MFFLFTFLDYYYFITVCFANIGTLGKYEQRQLWKEICIVYPFDLSLKKKSQN